MRGAAAALARRGGLSAGYVSEVRSGKKELGEPLANALGYVRRVTFHKIERSGA
jgi:hypothetical protein